MFLSVGILGIAAVYVLIYGTSQRHAEYTVTDPHPQHTSTGYVTERTHKRRAAGDDIVEVVESEPTVCDQWSNAPLPDEGTTVDKRGKAEMAQSVKEFWPKRLDDNTPPISEETSKKFDDWVQHYKCTAPEDPRLRNKKFINDAVKWFGVNDG